MQLGKAPIVLISALSQLNKKFIRSLTKLIRTTNNETIN